LACLILAVEIGWYSLEVTAIWHFIFIQVCGIKKLNEQNMLEQTKPKFNGKVNNAEQILPIQNEVFCLILWNSVDVSLVSYLGFRLTGDCQP